MKRRLAQCSRTLAAWFATLAVVSLVGAPAFGAKQEKKEEKKVDVVEAKNQKKRPTLKDDKKGPQFKAEEFIAEKQFENVKNKGAAIQHLKDLLESTPKNDPEHAEILFNLSEMYWDMSKYYEQAAFKKQDECFRLKEAGQKGRAKSCKRQMQDQLDESKRMRAKAVDIYKRIIRGHPNFKNLDKVLFYLATNLEQVDRKDEAMKVYRKLLSNFPDTQYAPNVLLAFGEYYFDEKKNPRRALKFYQKVKKFKDSSVYSYARYKAAWCYYNLEQKDKSLDIFIDVIQYAKAHPNEPNANALVKQVRKDIVLTYSEVGSPENAISFFKDLTDDREEVLKMTERLAIHYSDKSKYKYSTKMYRQLIQIRKRSVKTIDYQYEIVRNYTTEEPYRKSTIEELVKLMKLVQLAKQGKFEDLNEKKFKKTEDRVEQLVRQWATRFHREAQVTKNEKLYKMAFFLYDNFLDTFPKSKHLYTMTFFDAEILYHLHKWKKSARLYDKVIKMKKDGKFTKDAAHAAVLAYFKLVNTSEKQAKLESPLKFEKKDKVKEVKEGGTEKDDKIPEKKEISKLKKDLIAACGRYMKYVPDGKRIVDVKYTMARIYYEHNHFKKAVKRFKDIAFNHSDHRLAVISANLHLDTLNLTNDFEGLHEAVTAYMKKKPIDDDKFMGDVNRLNRAIRFKLCREKEDEEVWKKAANCYVQFYRDFPNSEYVDKALYNAALAFERIKELGKAIQVRVFLLKAAPNSDLAPKTLFNIGGNYHALAVYSRAAKFYEEFVSNFPDKEKMAEEALANASTFRQGLGHYDKAIKDYQKYLDLFGDDDKRKKKVADVAFQIAKIYEKQNKPKDALDQYETYIDDYADKGTQDRRLQAHVKVGLYYWNHDDKERALDEFEETLDVYDGIPKGEKEELTTGRDAAAQAKFMIGEDIYKDMKEISFENANADELEENEKKMQEIFTEKMEVAEKAQKIYEDVIKFRRPDWAIAALYKIGAQYQNFAETIRNSPIPERLTYDQKEIYRGLLEDKAVIVEKKAVDAYERALGVAKKESWFNKYSKKAEVRLADLRPKKYRKPSEMRAEPDNIHPGYSRSAFIDELKEDDGRLKKLGNRSSSSAPTGGSAKATETSGEPSS